MKEETGTFPNLQVYHARGSLDKLNFQPASDAPHLKVLDMRANLEQEERTKIPHTEMFEVVYPETQSQAFGKYLQKFSESMDTSPLQMETIRLFFEVVTERCEESTTPASRYSRTVFSK